MIFVQKIRCFKFLLLTSLIFGDYNLCAMTRSGSKPEGCCLSPAIEVECGAEREAEQHKISQAYDLWKSLINAKISGARKKMEKYLLSNRFFIAFDMDGVLIRVKEDFELLGKLPCLTRETIPIMVRLFNDAFELHLPVYIITARPETPTDEDGNVIEYKELLITYLTDCGLRGVTSKNMFAMPKKLHDKVIEAQKASDGEIMGRLVGAWKQSKIEEIKRELGSPSVDVDYVFFDDDAYNNPTDLIPHVCAVYRDLVKTEPSASDAFYF